MKLPRSRLAPVLAIPVSEDSGTLDVGYQEEVEVETEASSVTRNQNLTLEEVQNFTLNQLKLISG